MLSGVHLSRAYVSGMKQRNWGRIIFISSESGIFTLNAILKPELNRIAGWRRLATHCIDRNTPLTRLEVVRIWL